MIREMAEIPPELGQLVVNLENFLALTQHMKVIMYLSSIVLLFWLTGHYYNRSSHDRVVPSAGSWHNSANAFGQTNDSIAASERANSADSNRSQPPSRVISQAGSIDINEDRVASATSTTNQKVTLESKRNQVSSFKSMSNQQKASYNNRDNLGENDGNATMMSSNNETTKSINGPQQQNFDNDQSTRIGRLRGARFFSKVDEELENSKKKSGTESAKSKPKLKDQNQLAQSDSINYPFKGSNLNTNDETNSNESDIVNGITGKETDNMDQLKENCTKQKQTNKSWIMKVCYNVARILSGIRGTISEASQLDIRDNDYHDKQLEMLAGKIDNWYNSSANTALTTADAAAAAVELEAAAATKIAEKLERRADSDGSGSGENNLTATATTTTQLDVHDQNTNDSGSKCGLKTDTQAKLAVDSGKLGDQANKSSSSINSNKAQVNNSESSKKIGSKSKELFKEGEDKPTGGEVVVLDDKTMEIEVKSEKDIKVEGEDKEKKDKEKDENNEEKGEDLKLEQGEGVEIKEAAKSQEKDEKEIDGDSDKEEEEVEEGSEKETPQSQAGSIRRERTIKKKTGGEKAKEFEPINGNDSTPVELIDKESVADSELNLTNSSGTQTQLEKTEFAKTNSKPPLEQPEEFVPRVTESSSQTDLLPATMANGAESNTLQATIAQNLTSSRVDGEKIDDRGGGGGERGRGRKGVEEKEASIEKDGEDEGVEEEDESSNRNGTRNGTCVETNHNNRPDSVQSNRRIVNKSDTSGDESVEAASLVSAKQNKEDKAAAFEQIEMAMAIAQ